MGCKCLDFQLIVLLDTRGMQYTLRQLANERAPRRGKTPEKIG